jgi:hypothetical protein
VGGRASQRIDELVVLTWRRFNMWLSFLWLAAVPVAMVTGWIYSVAFISLVSIYANWASHLAAWRADA